jgi:hypothetical protein
MTTPLGSPSQKGSNLNYPRVNSEQIRKNKTRNNEQNKLIF